MAGGDLTAHLPPESGAALIHNDYKYDNLVLDPADLAAIRAVLDWEMATVGDPLMDLGTSLGYWVQADDPPALRIAPSKLFPKDVSVMVFASGKGEPGRKGEPPMVKIERVRFGQAVELPGAGPFDVYLAPEFTYAVRLAEKWTPKPGVMAPVPFLMLVMSDSDWRLLSPTKPPSTNTAPMSFP